MMTSRNHFVGRRSPLCALVAACAATFAPVQGSAAAGQLDDPAIPQEAVVRPKPAVTIEQFVDSMNGDFPGTTVIGAIPSRHTYKLHYPPGIPQLAMETYLEQQATAGGLLAWGEVNYQGMAAEGKTNEIWTSQLTIGAPQYDGQYAAGLLGLQVAHLKSEGQGVVVAILDTGVDFSHPALAAAAAPGAISFVTGAAQEDATDDVGDGLDNDGDGSVDEMVGHGTFVAGLVRLVAPKAPLMSVVVLDSDGAGDTFSIAQGLYHAIDNGAKVINCAFGSTYKGSAVEEAVGEAKSKGIVVVGAAGNFDTDEPEEFPALDSGAVGVAATDSTDIKAPFSNFHDKVDISAPGDSWTLGGNPSMWDPANSIVGPLPTSVGGGWAAWEGTSFATAFVSGVAALVRAQHPTAPPSAATAAVVVGAIQSGSVPIEGLNDPDLEGMLGAGRLSAAGAVEFAPPAPVPGDVTGDGAVDGGDLGYLLSKWGPCQIGVPCSADLDGSGTVDGGDLGALLALWGG